MVYLFSGFAQLVYIKYRTSQKVFVAGIPVIGFTQKGNAIQPKKERVTNESAKSKTLMYS